MQTVEYRTMDKSAWGPGPWQDEPDKAQYQDEVTGYPCLIVRNFLGALCGYVGVNKGHPAYGREYDDELLQGIYIHGGLSFAGGCQKGEESRAICHLPEPGEPDDVYWFGFDASHAGDWSPNASFMAYPSEVVSQAGRGQDVYRDLSYVREEIRGLALQLKALESSGGNA